MTKKILSVLFLLASFSIVACGGSSSTNADDGCDAACQDELERTGDSIIDDGSLE